MRSIQSPIFTASLRKLRWGAKGRSKRGGGRTIDYWAVADVVCGILYVYAKSEQGDLMPTALLALRRVVREELK